jgi:hypothetical protein
MRTTLRGSEHDRFTGWYDGDRLFGMAALAQRREEFLIAKSALCARISQEAPGEAPATPENLIAGAKLSQSIRRNGVTCRCRQAATTRMQ